MDADTTQTKKSRENIIDSFSTHKADILVGTQMITKGHNFPEVTLSAAVLADSGMFSSDYRAGERTFSLLTQLVGRSGRGRDTGKAIIQTYKPDSVAIQLGAKQDYDLFFENEILLRKAHNFPPFCDLAVITFTSDDEKELNNDAMSAAGIIKAIWQNSYSNLPITVFRPFAPPIYMLKNKYRLRVVIKFKNNSKSRMMLKEILKELDTKKNSTVSIDINPSDI
jgi:primosomal protein N' (replication factor Y)